MAAFISFPSEQDKYFSKAAEQETAESEPIISVKFPSIRDAQNSFMGNPLKPIKPTTSNWTLHKQFLDQTRLDLGQAKFPSLLTKKELEVLKICKEKQKCFKNENVVVSKQMFHALGAMLQSSNYLRVILNDFFKMFQSIHDEFEKNSDFRRRLTTNNSKCTKEELEETVQDPFYLTRIAQYCFALEKLECEKLLSILSASHEKPLTLLNIAHKANISSSLCNPAKDQDLYKLSRVPSSIINAFHNHSNFKTRSWNNTLASRLKYKRNSKSVKQFLEKKSAKKSLENKKPQ